MDSREEEREGVLHTSLNGFPVLDQGHIRCFLEGQGRVNLSRASTIPPREGDVDKRRSQRVFLPTHAYVASSVKPKESLLDRLARFKRETEMNKSLEMMKYSVGLVLWERGLMPEFIAS